MVAKKNHDLSYVNFISHDNEAFSPPRPEYVILRDSSGNVVHRYGDPVIELSIISTKDKGNKIDFTQLPSKLREEGRWLWFIIFFYGKGVNRNSLSVNTLYKYFYSFVKPLVIFSCSNNTNIFNVLGDKILLSKYIYFHQNESQLKASQGALSLYLQSGIEKTGFEVAYDDSLRCYVNQRVNDWKYIRQQVPVIPPRIFKAKASLMWEAVEELELHIEGLEKLISFLINEPPIRTEKKNLSKAPEWERVRKSRLLSIINDCGLSKYLKQNKCETRVEITSFLTSVQSLCKELIHLYSGMRDNEVLQLDYHCIKVEHSKSRVRARIIGNTTKYVGNKKIEQWITSSDIERVVSILQALARPIASKIGLSLDAGSLTLCPLFISMIYLSRYESTTKNYPFGKRADVSNIRLSKPIVRLKQIKIEEEDIVFLERLEPGRDWRSEPKYFVGNAWRFTSHQYRRSLAVYAAQSGLVSLGALQTQLKHLLREVTFYYANGAENIEGIFEIKNNHIAKLYHSQKALADFTAYAVDVLFSEEPLIGVSGKFAEKHNQIIKDTNEQKQLLLKDRVNTIKKFKQGAMAYKATALGGCSSIRKCNSYLTNNFISCLSCDSAFIKPSKLKSGISVLKSYLDNVDSSTVEYRTEKMDYDKLVEFTEKWL